MNPLFNITFNPHPLFLDKIMEPTHPPTPSPVIPNIFLTNYNDILSPFLISDRNWGVYKVRCWRDQNHPR